MSTLPQSYETFKITFKAIAERANRAELTLFENNVDVAKIEENMIFEHYEYFQKNYLHSYLTTNDNKIKQSLMKQSITESFLQETFNKVLDNILLEGETTYSNQILLENTVDKFNLDLNMIGKPILESVHSKYSKEIKEITENTSIEDMNLVIPDCAMKCLIEHSQQSCSTSKEITENAYGTVGGIGAGAGAMALGATVTGALPVAIGTATIISVITSLFLPASKINQVEQFMRKWTGEIGVMLTGSFSYLLNLNNFSSAKQSLQNILKFDNIDADPKVIEMFKKIIQSNPNNKNVEMGLQSLIAQCIDQNKNIFNIADKEVRNSWLQNPQNGNLAKIFWKSTFGNANNDKGDQDILLRFRKCLSTKLVDTYKLLLLSNLENRRDHKHIVDSIRKVGVGRAENILNFLTAESPEDKVLNEAILNLVMFRIHLLQLAKELQQGAFTVDKEAGKFLEQKLNMVDGEVENALRLHQSRNRPPFEGNLMNRKPFEGKKRFLLSNQSQL